MAKPSYVAGYVPQLIEAGHSATSALAFLRDKGQRINDRTFYRLWGETIDYLSRSEGFVDHPDNRRPSPDLIGIATRPRARGHLYNFAVPIEDQHTGEISFHAHSVKSDKLISISLAKRLAVESFTGRMENNPGSIQGRVLGAMLTGVLQMVGENE